MSGARRVEPSMAEILAEIRQMVGQDGAEARLTALPSGLQVPPKLTRVASPTSGPMAVELGLHDDMSDLLEPVAQNTSNAPPTLPRPVAPPDLVRPVLTSAARAPSMPAPSVQAPVLSPTASGSPAATTPIAARDDTLVAPLVVEPLQPERVAATSPAAEAPPAVSHVAAPAPDMPPPAPANAAARSSRFGGPIGEAIPAPVAQPDARAPLSVGSIDALIGALRPSSVNGPKTSSAPPQPTLPVPGAAKPPPALDDTLDQALGALAAGLAARGVGAARVEPAVEPVAPQPLGESRQAASAGVTPVGDAAAQPASMMAPSISPVTPAPEAAVQEARLPLPAAAASVSAVAEVAKDVPVVQVDVVSGPEHAETAVTETMTAPEPAEGLDDRMAELLRPMLRQWLDANLPRIVEKALRVELAAGVAPKRPTSDVRSSSTASGHA